MLIKVNNKFPSIEDNTYISPTSSVIGDVLLKLFPEKALSGSDIKS